MPIFQNKTIVITGGTGSLGKVLTRRLLSGKEGTPAKIIIFSRDEAKQHFMRVEYEHNRHVTDEVIYHNFSRLLEFRLGDVRDYHAMCAVLQNADMVINAAALKQVPSCEYFPFQAVMTNISGAENIVRVIREHNLKVESVVGVSTDKACKPVNVMGMTKSIQERIFIAANLTVPDTRFICTRYGNVLASRGSVIPLFHDQIKQGGPVTVTTCDMTRFLLPLEHAVDTIIAALEMGSSGDTFVPKVPAARIMDVAQALIGNRKIAIEITGIRPGEKIHEIMVSDEEAWHTFENGDYYVIKPMLPELLQKESDGKPLPGAYSSADTVMNLEETRAMLKQNGLLIEQQDVLNGEFLK
ncbi:polysaccharide biosynthesis protein [Thermodesulfobacteriota bacterium]